MSARAILHAAVLNATNGCGFALGILAVMRGHGQDQPPFRVLIWTVVSLMLFLLWSKLVQARGPRGIRLRDRRDWLWVYLLAPVWWIVLFVPLHYFTQGYLTSFGNIAVGLAVQLPINAFIVIAAAEAARGPAASGVSPRRE
jgi:hypothetical protein